MSRKKAEPEQPTGGGSYLRQSDGSLKRVEATVDADQAGSPAFEPDAPIEASAPADQQD